MRRNHGTKKYALAQIRMSSSRTLYLWETAPLNIDAKTGKGQIKFESCIHYTDYET